MLLQVISAVISNPSRLASTVMLGVIGMWSFMLLGIAFFFGRYNLNDSSDDWAVVCKDFSTCFGCVFACFGCVGHCLLPRQF